MSSNVIWYEYMGTDQDAARRFYSAVVGWDIEPEAPEGGKDYRMIAADDGLVGGSFLLPPEARGEGMPKGWYFYIYVEDVDQAVAAIVADGGSVCMPAFDIPVGRIALVADPQGAVFYVMKPIGAEQSKVFQPGTAGHGHWHELHTKDSEAAFAFYRKHFGWEHHSDFDMGPMGIYRMFKIGEVRAGGMMNNNDVPHPAWAIYFNVPSVDAAAKSTVDAGGKVLMGPMEVPSGEWIIMGQDPLGAQFAVLGKK